MYYLLLVNVTVKYRPSFWRQKKFSKIKSSTGGFSRADKNIGLKLRSLDHHISNFENWNLWFCIQDFTKVFNFTREVISTAHISISTADHEFFGVSMVEAAHVSCYCLVPNRLRNVFSQPTSDFDIFSIISAPRCKFHRATYLVSIDLTIPTASKNQNQHKTYLSYPEIFSKEFRYNTEAQLKKQLKNLIRAGPERLITQTTDKMKLLNENLCNFDSEIVCNNILNIIVDSEVRKP